MAVVFVYIEEGTEIGISRIHGIFNNIVCFGKLVVLLETSCSGLEWFAKVPRAAVARHRVLDKAGVFG